MHKQGYKENHGGNNHTHYTLGLRYLTGCARAESRPVAVKITSEISAKSE